MVMKQHDKPVILLTGGAGYIGSHTAVVLQEAGYEVVILDNYSNSSPSAVKSIGRITGKSPRVLQVDLLDRQAVLGKLSVLHYDAVIHFAGLKAVGESMGNPGKYYRDNLTMSINLLDAMRMKSVDKLIFSSSATVYGEPEVLPLSESARAGLGITNPYGWTKSFTEQIIRDYGAYEKSPISSVLLRYFNPIGAHSSGLIGERPQGVPNNLLPFISQVAAKKREKLMVFGDDYPTSDGTCLRDYINVEDLAEAHLKALEYLLEGGNSEPTEVFNVATGTPTSVLELLRAFESSNGLEIPFEIAPRRSGDVPELYADPSKIQSALQWLPTRSLEESCRSAWTFERTHLSTDR